MGPQRWNVPLGMRGQRYAPRGRRFLLATLADVLVVGRGDLLRLVASQLDAASHLRGDGGLVPAFPEQRVYCLYLVPT